MRSIQHYVIKFCQWFAAGRWFSPDSPVSSTSKTDHHDITKILLNVALNNTNKININSLVDVIYLYIYIVPVLQESSEGIIPTGVIGGLVGAIGILIIVIVGLLYSRKSGKFLNTNQSINQRKLLYTDWCNLSSCLLTSEMPS